jgi:hypothetical protein
VDGDAVQALTSVWPQLALVLTLGRSAVKRLDRALDLLERLAQVFESDSVTLAGTVSIGGDNGLSVQ